MEWGQPPCRSGEAAALSLCVLRGTLSTVTQRNGGVSRRPSSPGGTARSGAKARGQGKASKGLGEGEAPSYHRGQGEDRSPGPSRLALTGEGGGPCSRKRTANKGRQSHALGGLPLPPSLGDRRLLGQPHPAKKGNKEKGKLSGPRASNQARGSKVSLL